MSMIGNALAISPETLRTLLDDPSRMESLLFPDSGGPDAKGHMDLDKAWHAIHFVLNEKAWEGEGALGAAILGGHELGEDMGYGPARYLTAEDVSSVAEALDAVTLSDFEHRFNAEALAAESIYPDVWDESRSELLEYLLPYYEALKAFYANAAREGNAVLLYLN